MYVFDVLKVIRYEVADHPLEAFVKFAFICLILNDRFLLGRGVE